LDGIFDRLEQVRQFPESGALRHHIRPGLRMVAKYPYVAYYLATQTEIIVVRVLHSSRDIDAISAEEGFDT
jgi:toxin ParE1/3/4